MERDPLIRVHVLCNLLLETLDELDTEAFSTPQLLEQLREVSNRATEELDQLASGRE